MDAKKRAALATASLAVAGAFSLILGLFVADPFATIETVQALRLRRLGARQEFFRAPDGTQLRTWAVGSSSRVPVVLLHGLGAAGDYWTGLVPDLNRSGRSAFLPDAPGSGGSERPRDPSGYGVANRVAAVSALVEAMGFEEIDLVGHSLGGWTAARFAIENPRRVRKLVLVDAGGMNPPPAPSAEALERAKLSPDTRAGGRALIDLLFFRKPFPVNGFLADAFARHYRSENVTGTLDALRPEDWLLADLPKLPSGTVVIWGEKETLFPIDEVRPVVSRIPGVRFLVITGVGHDGPLEATKVFNAALLDVPGGS
ncbi:MAG: alpha/beta hydrolase [Thermoanaerobaculia bacterium]|nr:alpha/beta hydrolase [Thermoanaerobaculia bacterium]